MSDIKLGNLITTPQKRDAIHVAVIPAFSHETLSPGQHVGIVDGSEIRVEPNTHPVGVVDPFLTESVPPNTRFWLLLYQGTAKNLRHDWSHPQMSNSDVSEEDLDSCQPVITSAKERIAAFAETLGMSCDSMIYHAKDYLENSEYINVGYLEGMGLPSTFWDDYQTITGTQVSNENRGSFFSCSCS